MEPGNSSGGSGVTVQPVSTDEHISYISECREKLFDKLTVNSLHPTEHILGDSEMQVSPSDDIAWPIDAFAVVAEKETTNETKFIGCCVLSIKHHWQMNPHVSSRRVDYDDKMGAVNAWIEILYVEPDARNNGVGSELLSHQLDTVTDETRASTIFMLNWNREDDPDAVPLLKSADFEHLYDSEYYFETVEERKHCPDCEITVGDGDYCSCSASMWRKTV